MPDAVALSKSITADRDDWPRVKFGDVVKNVSETCRDPEADGLDRYVGLEHIDSDNLHIKRWGSLAEDEVSFTRRFRAGQVLFGKRRAYLRKVAVPEFDGICSSDILCFEPKDPGTLLPDLLPFLVQSDRFFDHALGTSSGSLSPRTRWSQLKDFEFSLPPLDEQRRMAQVVKETDTTAEAWRATGDHIARTSRRVAGHLWRRGFGGKSKSVASPFGPVPQHWTVAPFGDFVRDSAYGPRFPATQYAGAGNVQTVRTTDFDRSGGLDLTTAPFTTLGERVIERHQLMPGDFLLSRSGEYAGLTATFPEVKGCFVAAAFVIYFRLKETLLSEYLVHLCYADFGDAYVLPLATGSAQPNISGSAMLAVPIPVPPLDEQRAIVSFLDQVESARVEACEHKCKCRSLQAFLSTRLFGEHP